MARSVATLLLALGTLANAPTAQTNQYSNTLLPLVRRAAALPPGDPPTAIHVGFLNPFRGPLSSVVEGGSTDSASAAYTVFQIRFPRGWIIVDAALDREFVPHSTTFSDEDYDRIQRALRDARLIVVTHEHHDHIAGVIRSPYLVQVRQHTLLTRSQVNTLLERPNSPRIRIDSTTAQEYLTNEYDLFAPIAPGVVLIKAPGHTPGSQMVHIRLASGQEVILAGDIAWNMLGITEQRQKPEETSRALGEDRNAIAEQLQWLKDVSGPQTAVVVSHDVARINALIERGVLRSDFDFTNP